MKWQKCSYDRVLVSARFCPNCGETLSEAPLSPSQITMRFAKSVNHPLVSKYGSWSRD